MKVPVSMSDKKKSYYKYYDSNIVPAYREKIEAIKEIPNDNATALRIEDRNDLFKEGYLPGEFGWWSLEDGSAIVANQTFMKDVTGEMFDWWFAWHPLDRLRYALWDNEDHYDVYLKDKKRAMDTSLSLRERNWGSVHYVWEDIGTGRADLLELSFKSPKDMGYDVSKIDTDLCNTIICANGLTFGNDKMPDAPAFMTHFVRPVEGGIELRSRFWMGYHIIDGEPVKLLPDGINVPPITAISLLKHNVKEFTNLADILPKVYAEEKDNF